MHFVQVVQIVEKISLFKKEKKKKNAPPLDDDDDDDVRIFTKMTFESVSS